MLCSSGMTGGNTVEMRGQSQPSCERRGARVLEVLKGEVDALSRGMLEGKQPCGLFSPS
jgi:hypothetical protein